MARIGFIGLGNMGLPMAQNLLKAGHQVEGVDVNPASVEKLRAAGGAGVETAKSAATARGRRLIIKFLLSNRDSRFAIRYSSSDQSTIVGIFDFAKIVFNISFGV